MLVVDAILAIGLVGLALRVVTGRDLFRDTVLFIVFGLVMAVVWARLGAADLALAEAAIGAGLTGALMLVAYRRLERQRLDVAEAAAVDVDPGGRRRRGLLTIPVAVLAGAMVAVVGLLSLGIEPVVEGAGAATLAALEGTGIGNPVTGVLLVFRGLDTLLEMVVLLVALIGSWAITPAGPPEPVARLSRDAPLVGALLTLVAPLGLLIAVHLLLAGTAAPGGAFQAGAVLAACGVLLVLTGVLRPAEARRLVTRLLIVAGVAAFVAVGVGVSAFGHAPMAMPGLWAVYLVEAAMMVSIAVTLTLLFARSRDLEAEPR